MKGTEYTKIDYNMPICLIIGNEGKGISKVIKNNCDMSEKMKRKVDLFLNNWKKNQDRKPLIIKGARQIGKTYSIEQFAYSNYKCVVKINFVEQQQKYF